MILSRFWFVWQAKHRKTSKFCRAKTRIELDGSTNAAEYPKDGACLPVRKHDAAVAGNIGIYPRLKRGQIFNGVTVFRLRARLGIFANQIL